MVKYTHTIDDIFSLDLSNAKHQALAKEILNKYLLTPLEKDRLLEKLKENKNNGGDDAEYLYIVSSIMGADNPLLFICSQCKGINYGTEKGIYDDTNDNKYYLSNGGFLASAYKINPNQKIYDSDSNTYIKVSEFLKKKFSEDEIVYITKEQYEKTSGIPIHGVYSSSSLNFENVDGKKIASDLMSVLNHIRNNNLNINDFYYFYLHCFDFSDIFDYCRITDYYYNPADDNNSESYSITVTGSNGGPWPIIVTSEDIYPIG